MKKIKMLAVLSALATGLSFFSCNNLNGGNSHTPDNNPEDNPDPNNGNEENNTNAEGLDGITINGTKLSYTEEVKVTESTITITNDKIPDSDHSFDQNHTISPFIMGKYEVTQELYKAVMTGQKIGDVDLDAEPSLCTANSTRYALPVAEQKYRPVENVTIFDAYHFCNALSEKLGLQQVYTISNAELDGGHIINATVTVMEGKNGYRLPTNAEWEFAARGGNPTIEDWNYTYSGSNTLNEVGWYQSNIDGTEEPGVDKTNNGQASDKCGTQKVGQKTSNKLRIFDMSGNVFEWVHGNYYDYDYVDRGGSWATKSDYAQISNVGGISGNFMGATLGIRLARSIID